MVRSNDHYLKLKAGYLFPEIGRRVRAFQESHPDASLIRLGIGDVVLPLPQSVRQALHEAVDEMGSREGFKGYGPEQGYEFLRQAIVDHDFKKRGVDLAIDEIFVSDGSKCDSGNLQEIFDAQTTIAVTDPVYPVYVDTNVMAGRTGSCNEKGYYSGIEYLPVTAENNFIPELPSNEVGLIYLCSPNNPTGAVMTRDELKKWVDYARDHGSVIIFDAAYEAFINDPDLPHSIYEIEGAKEVAIEMRSFSKTAGFTGTRCAYTVVPQALMAQSQDGSKVSLNKLWNRRQSTKYNGVPYIIQKGAAACYTEQGQAEIQQLVSYYMENARLIREGLASLGLEAFGGENAPYIWLKTPQGVSSWTFFDQVLNQAHVVGTPGAGFGPSGEGYFRLSAFGIKEKVQEAIERMVKKVAF